MKQYSTKKNIIIASLIIITLLIIALVIYYNPTRTVEDELETQPATAYSDILTPSQDELKVLKGSPIQIQSKHPKDISEVTLYAKKKDEPDYKIISVDTPQDGWLIQEWIPQEDGIYSIKINETKEKEIHVIGQQTVGIALTETGYRPTQIEPTKIAVPPIPTTSPIQSQEDGDIQSETSSDFQISEAVQTIPEETPIPSYPPPPPAPGVPWGPTQDELAPHHAPVCDAAQYIEVFIPDRNQRVSIAEPDDIAVKAVAGTTVHRAWRLKNIGTCTWGPGYELAFYGGRAMGSGGVAFESTYPTDPPRRNTLIDNNRLIVPEGKPNQTAVLELLLNVPTTPGIHQSYWRMRNPHGVYFGPILGVTLEVIRDCDFSTPNQKVYGAPIINRFVILGVGDVYQPTNPINVLATQDEAVVLEWNITNATNFDIVFVDPTGDLESVTTTDTNSRATFHPTTIGQHHITLYADNGICTSQAKVDINVVPNEGEGFKLDIASTTCTTTQTEVDATLAQDAALFQWNHFDPSVNQITLNAQAYQRTLTKNKWCPLLGWDGYCIEQETWSDWKPIGNPKEIQLGNSQDGAKIVTNTNPDTLCARTGLTTTTSTQETVIRYIADAKINNQTADPPQSNTIDCRCGSTGNQLPLEIQGTKTDIEPIN